MDNEIALGIDVGSTTVKVVALDREGGLMAGRYARSHGRPRQTLVRELAALAADLGLTPDQLAARARVAGCTGSGGSPVAARIGALHVNELVAQTRAVGEYYPQAHTVIEIGGQDSKFLSVAWDPALGKMILVDMAMNNLCAAGTGAFLDQQAERLGIAIEGEFAALAMQSATPARIAGRCTVFAKSDMIHLQQKGTPIPDILAGLCMALARNFRTVIGKGKSFAPPIVFQGGVAYNQAVLRAFGEVLRLQPEEIIVPPHHHLMPAIGCALVARDEAAVGRCPAVLGFDALHDGAGAGEIGAGSLPPLTTARGGFADRRPFRPEAGPQRNGATPPRPLYLGVDVGSITTKVVAVDPHGAVQARRYLPTQGRPLDVVRRALLEVGQELGDAVQVLGVGVTGSGRHLTAEFVGGDVVRSEITAQARAALAVDPEVDTIFEIGGQDSKYIRLAEGAIVNFAMNSACAAGTGSFLEEQADRLQIDLAEEFSRDALCAACPVALGERCTVFMESDLVHHQQQGAHVDNLAAGLAYAIVENYLNRVVGAQTIGRRIFFQGGVAWNDSVVAAFQARLGRPVRVPPHHDVSGAIGAALLARDELTARRLAGEAIASRFRGFDLGALHYAARAFICQACPNLCEINRVTIGDEAPVFYGARCDMYEQAGRGPTVHGAAARPADLPDLFAERERLLMGGYTPPEPHAGRPRVGIPRTLHFYDLFPFWRTFFDALDMDIVLSSMTNPSIARATKDYATAETCYPVKLVFGHVAELLDSAPDFLFLPAIINREHAAPGQNENTYCPYIRSSGHLVEAAMTDRLSGMKVITSRLHMQWPTLLDQDLTQMAAALGIPAKAVRDAAAAGLAAQAAFHAQLRQRGQQVLAALTGETPALVLVGRPYNTADQGCSQDLPYKLRKLGVLPIPLDYLPLDPVDVSDRFPHMFWRCGQDILAGAQIIRDDPRLHAVYVTSFGCGPDSFILSYFRRIMAGKPHLELELDDHTADAGVLTRCEAFVESLRILQQRPMPKEFA